MSREVDLVLSDIEESATLVLAWCESETETTLFANRVLIDAVIRNLEVIGEACKNVPTDVRLLAPDIPWRRVAGFRDVFVHGYFRIDAPAVWDVIRNACRNFWLRSGD